MTKQQTQDIRQAREKLDNMYRFLNRNLTKRQSDEIQSCIYLLDNVLSSEGRPVEIKCTNRTIVRGFRELALHIVERLPQIRKGMTVDFALLCPDAWPEGGDPEAFCRSSEAWYGIKIDESSREFAFALGRTVLFLSYYRGDFVPSAILLDEDFGEDENISIVEDALFRMARQDESLDISSESLYAVEDYEIT